ncbi:hypothetical protein [Psychrobacter sp. LV10R520-6]|jgi:hypothetical protein|uniref:hypothetical protein n=1 Tax=Psychrobacter sp. LV10R520-6 TaxID=1415574 RepID=UPI0024CB5A05|nr:hypothetical protein [Psychrobacter sp. LV10R520-6]SNT70931.1 hypothetical protein SAMN04488491_2127 [Psychrobacter sp. LV10R520-6]
MIEVTEAVKLARKLANDFYQDEDIKNLGLEEVVFDDDSKEWRITLGYDSYRVKTTETAPNPYSAISAFAPSNIEKETLREYKTFRIGAEDAIFKGMLIRDVG